MTDPQTPEAEDDWRTSPPIPMDPNGPINDAESTPFLDTAYAAQFESGGFVALPLSTVMDRAIAAALEVAAMLGLKSKR